MRWETRRSQPFLRMLRNTSYGRAGRGAVKAAAIWMGARRSLDASESRRLWSARLESGSQAGVGAGIGRARSSAEEHCLHTAGVAGSNPAAPTMEPWAPFVRIAG